MFPKCDFPLLPISNSAVGESGQLVVKSAVQQLFFGAFALGDVAGDTLNSYWHRVLGQNSAADFQRQTPPVGSDNLDFVFGSR